MKDEISPAMPTSPISYHHGKFPPERLNLETLLPLVGPANAALARYDGTLAGIPNASLLLAPLTTQEAVLSSRIEGTHATMGEVFEFEAEHGSEAEDASDERKADIQEVLNYRRAMNHAINAMESLPLSQRLIREAHAVLLRGVRGENKDPGNYRRIPVWIGPTKRVEEARFLPIDAGKIDEAMGRWENYLHSDAPDGLIQLAIAHAEFESIHPFLDGNGRLGRMLVPLFLLHSRIIRTPMFYLSGFFEEHRDEYYDRLLAVSADDDWTGWCAFFLRAVTHQAEVNEGKVRAFLQLYNELKPLISEWTHSQYSIHALDWIFRQPVFNTVAFMAASGIPAPTARRVLRVLREQGLLRVLRESSGRRPAILGFSRLMNLAEGREVF